MEVKFFRGRYCLCYHVVVALGCENGFTSEGLEVLYSAVAKQVSCRPNPAATQTWHHSTSTCLCAPADAQRVVRREGGKGRTAFPPLPPRHWGRCAQG